MQTLTETLIEQGLRNRVVTERQLERAVGGSPTGRYGLVNRALKANELTRIRRGLYVLAPRYRTEPMHPFAIAQALVPSSYISLETALAHHGWIPEAVRTVASVVPGRKSAQVDHQSLGTFTFHPLALDRLHYLELVERKPYGSQVAFVAKAPRALMDLACLRKRTWQGIDWLVEGLRIDTEHLHTITRADIQILLQVYTQQRPKQFLRSLAQELSLD